MDTTSTISEVFDHVLECEPGRTALVTPSGSLSYEALDQAANAAAAVLAGLGVGAGDRVAACLPNEADIAVAFHGAMRRGAVWVGINRNLAPPEKQALLHLSTPSLFLTEAEIAEQHRSPDLRVLTATAGDPGSEWAEALAAERGAPRLPAPDRHLPAGIAFTSGTTGTPKGIVHSQHNLLMPAKAIVASRRYDQTLRKGDCLPMTILNVQVLTTLLTASAGGTCVLTDHRLARPIAEWIAAEGINVWNGVPAILYSMVHDPEIEPRWLAGLREVWTGGAPCPDELHDAFRARFGHDLFHTYGLTEAPTIAAMDPVGSTHVAGTSGVALPDLDLLVLDEAGKESPAGQVGEMALRATTTGEWAGAYTPMLGYWVDGVVEPFGRQVLPTGDLGYLDDGGRVVVKDRKKLMILRGGANVYPAEVERVIQQIPAVSGSAVLGLPDDRLGERVVAVVEIASGDVVDPQDVIAHCRLHLARYKVPEQVKLVAELERNAMGKIRRDHLSELFAIT